MFDLLINFPDLHVQPLDLAHIRVVEVSVWNFQLSMLYIYCHTKPVNVNARIGLLSYAVLVSPRTINHVNLMLLKVQTIKSHT